MRRSLQIAFAVLLLTGAAIAALPTTATVAPESDLQIMTSGRDGLAAPEPACERVRNTRLCFEGSKPTCKGACR